MTKGENQLLEFVIFMNEAVTQTSSWKNWKLAMVLGEDWCEIRVGLCKWKLYDDGEWVEVQEVCQIHRTLIHATCKGFNIDNLHRGV